LNYTTKDFIRQ